MSVTIAKTLQNFTGLEPGNGETAESFAKRLALKANGLSEDEWHTLGGSDEGRKAQKWVNAFLEAMESGEDLPLLEGNPQLNGPAAIDWPEDPPTAKAKAKKPKAPKKKAPPRRGRSGSYPMDATIELLVEGNPMLAGSKVAERYAKYRTGMTVEEALDAGLNWSDFKRDTAKGRIAIHSKH